jgi:signal transduction histidine kinase
MNDLAVLFPIVGCILNFALAIFVLATGFRRAANRIYFLWGVSVTIWHIGGFFCFTARTPEEGLLAVRFCWIGVLFVPVLLLHLSLAVAHVPVRRYVYVLYGLTGALLLSNATPFFIRSARWLGTSGYYAIPGPGFYIFISFFGIVFFSIYVLLRRRKTLPAQHRTQLDALIFGQTILVLFGTNDLLPILDIEKYPFTDWPVYPYGYAAATLYGLIFAYSVLQRQLLDIQIQLSRFAAQGVRLLFLFFTGLALFLTATLIAPDEFSAVSIGSGVAALVVSSAIATILFPRLFGSDGADKWERRILGDRFEYQDQVRGFIANITWYSNLPDFLEDLHQLFIRAFRLRSYAIILRDQTTRAFTLLRAHPTEDNTLALELELDSPIFRYFEGSKGEFLSLRRDAIRVTSSLVQHQAREQLAGFDAELCFPLMSQSELFGLLLVGSKSAQEPFTATDLILLESLVKSMGLMVNQIRLKDQLLHAQELDLLGRMSRGMAHDLNNLLTPVSTLIQLAHETGSCNEELLPTALRNVTTMQAYIKESLFFSQHSVPDLRLGRLDLVVQETVETAGASRKKHVELLAETPDEVVIEMNEVLIQRLLTNIISNAIDASAPSACIRVKLECLPRSEPAREWFRLQVVDQGEGISRENLERVQTPYFTTKNSGDETRGFGLGLAICRKIVSLHGGRISIESQVKRGTTVCVDLPSRQITHERPGLVPFKKAV